MRISIFYAISIIWLCIVCVGGWARVNLRSKTTADVEIFSARGTRILESVPVSVSPEAIVLNRPSGFEQNFGIGYVRRSTSSTWSPSVSVRSGQKVRATEVIKKSTEQGDFFDCVEDGDKPGDIIASFIGRSICANTREELTLEELIALSVSAIPVNQTGVVECDNVSVANFVFGASSLSACGLWS